MKRKILMILMSFVLLGCGKADVPSFDDANTTDVNGYHTYYNMDKLCAQLERVDKKYDMTDPQDMIKNAGQVLVMGHKNSDLDSFGASIGVAKIAMAYGKKTNVIIDFEDDQRSIRSTSDYMARWWKCIGFNLC